MRRAIVTTVFALTVLSVPGRAAADWRWTHWGQAAADVERTAPAGTTFLHLKENDGTPALYAVVQSDVFSLRAKFAFGRTSGLIMVSVDQIEKQAGPTEGGKTCALFEERLRLLMGQPRTSSDTASISFKTWVRSGDIITLNHLNQPSASCWLSYGRMPDYGL